MTTTLVAIGRFCVVTYLLYGIGYAVPFLRHDLQIGSSVAGLHASAAALGLVVAGLSGDRFIEWVGEGKAIRIGLVFLVLFTCIVAFTGQPALTLSGCFGLGCASGLILAWANRQLTAGGREAAVPLLARANVAALLAALLAPLVIAGADELGLDGRLGLLAPLPMLGVVEWLGRRLPSAAEPAPGVRQGERSPRLPQSYWRAWLALVMAIGIEFSIVYWSSSLISARTSVALGPSTVAAAAFIAGMIASRLILAVGAWGGVSHKRLMTASFTVVVIAVIAVWQANTTALAAAALFVAGLGVGPLYPVGIALAIGTAPLTPITAANRTTLASGTAILVAPFALSVLAEQIGLLNAWPTIAILALGGVIALSSRAVRVAVATS